MRFDEPNSKDSGMPPAIGLFICIYPIILVILIYVYRFNFRIIGYSIVFAFLIIISLMFLHMRLKSEERIRESFKKAKPWIFFTLGGCMCCLSVILPVALIKNQVYSSYLWLWGVTANSFLDSDGMFDFFGITCTIILLIVGIFIIRTSFRLRRDNQNITFYNHLFAEVFVLLFTIIIWILYKWNLWKTGGILIDGGLYILIDGLLLLSGLSIIYFPKKRRFNLEVEENKKTFLEIVNDSDRIMLDKLESLLKLTKKKFDSKVIDWAIEYDLKIDGKELIINRDSLSEFINELDKHFKKWSETEKNGAKIS